MSPAVRLRHLRNGIYNISTPRFLLHGVYNKNLMHQAAFILVISLIKFDVNQPLSHGLTHSTKERRKCSTCYTTWQVHVSLFPFFLPGTYRLLHHHYFCFVFFQVQDEWRPSPAVAPTSEWGGSNSWN
jgi:hypothetical protein